MKYIFAAIAFFPALIHSMDKSEKEKYDKVCQAMHKFIALKHNQSIEEANSFLQKFETNNPDALKFLSLALASHSFLTKVPLTKIQLHTNSIVSKPVFDKLWPKLEQFGTLENVDNWYLDDLCTIAEGGQILPKERFKTLEDFGLPTASKDITQDEKVIILASRKFIMEEYPHMGANFVNAVNGKVISPFTAFLVLG